MQLLELQEEQAINDMRLMANDIRFIQTQEGREEAAVEMRRELRSVLNLKLITEEAYRLLYKAMHEAIHAPYQE